MNRNETRLAQIVKIPTDKQAGIKTALINDESHRQQTSQVSLRDKTKRLMLHEVKTTKSH